MIYLTARNVCILFISLGAMGWMTRVHFLAGTMMVFFLFTTMFRLALGLTQPHIQWVPGALTPGVKWLVHEADHSPPSGAKVKNAWRFTSTPAIHLYGEEPHQAQGQLSPFFVSLF
jgi:hypothetical protein